MKYTLDWLTNPEVFAVNRIAAAFRPQNLCKPIWKPMQTIPL